MTNYNYLEAMKEDVKNYIMDEIETKDFSDREELEEKLNEDLWISDSVTGNASGSYTFNTCKAKEYVLVDGLDHLRESALEGFTTSEEIGKMFVSEDWETMDVIIRCFLLNSAIYEALDELEEEEKLIFSEEE